VETYFSSYHYPPKVDSKFEEDFTDEDIGKSDWNKIAALVAMVDLWVLELCMLSEAFTYGVHEFRAIPLIQKMLKLHGVVRVML
jgi:hypothetical protein